ERLRADGPGWRHRLLAVRRRARRCRPAARAAAGAVGGSNGEPRGRRQCGRRGAQALIAAPAIAAVAPSFRSGLAGVFGLFRRRLGLGPAIGLALLLAGLAVGQRRNPRARRIGLALGLIGDLIAGALALGRWGLGCRRLGGGGFGCFLLRLG